MMYYPTNRQSGHVDLKHAILNSLAPGKALYMPQEIPRMPKRFFNSLPSMGLPEIGYELAHALFGQDMAKADIEEIVHHSLDFDIPLVQLADGVSTLELFHGPTLAFKDVGAGFMARMLAVLTSNNDSETNVLVATSGDTGGAVANGFHGVPGVKVTVLYPMGKVSVLQEKQFTTQGGNIKALEVEGSFDDCQALVKQAFSDQELNGRLRLTSANSINLARLLPQSFYYMYAWAQWPDKQNPPYISVPSGNFGNLCAALIAKRMGMPVAGFIAATNINDTVPQYLSTGTYRPKASRQTISNAMDVGDPSNFVRIQELYGHSREAMKKDISAYAYTDEQTRQSMKDMYRQLGYIPDPHGAVAYRALKVQLGKVGGKGYFVETAHPAKFKQTVDETLGTDLSMPDRLAKLISKEKRSIRIKADYENFKQVLLSV